MTPVATQTPVRRGRTARMVTLRSSMPVQLVTLRHSVPLRLADVTPEALLADLEAAKADTTAVTTPQVERELETVAGKGDAR